MPICCLLLEIIRVLLLLLAFVQSERFQSQLRLRLRCRLLRKVLIPQTALQYRCYLRSRCTSQPLQ